VPLYQLGSRQHYWHSFIGLVNLSLKIHFQVYAEETMMVWFILFFQTLYNQFFYLISVKLISEIKKTVGETPLDHLERP
jgi:hypothetical protein